MINYAIMLYAEEGVQIDRKEALNYFRIAADKGHQEEMFKYTYIQNIEKRIIVNKEESSKYYKMAADKRNLQEMCNYAKKWSSNEY